VPFAFRDKPKASQDADDVKFGLNRDLLAQNVSPIYPKTIRTWVSSEAPKQPEIDPADSECTLAMAVASKTPIPVVPPQVAVQ